MTTAADIKPIERDDCLARQHNPMIKNLTWREREWLARLWDAFESKTKGAVKEVERQAETEFGCYYPKFLLKWKQYLTARTNTVGW